MDFLQILNSYFKVMSLNFFLTTFLQKRPQIPRQRLRDVEIKLPSSPLSVTIWKSGEKLAPDAAKRRQTASG